jgi:serine/threonine protein kinase
VGTPAYMSPEQARGGQVDARSDIFSFGTVLYEIVTGRRAFAGTSVTETLGAVIHLEPKAPSELVPGVPKELERLILRCLGKDPARRIQHMADVKVELVELEESVASGPTTRAIADRQRRRTRRLAPTDDRPSIVVLPVTWQYLPTGRRWKRPWRDNGHARVVGARTPGTQSRFPLHAG